MQTPETMNDLAIKSRNGDREALLKLWQGVSRLAYKIAMRYRNAAALNGAVDDEDLEQCAFLGFYEALEGYDALQGNFSTYMCWYVKNACRNLLGLNGRERKEHYVTTSMDEPIPGAEDITLADTITDESAALPFEHAELRQDIEKALHRLPDNIENIIRLHDLEGLPMDQAAAQQGYTLNSGRNLRRQGFYKLRQDRSIRDYNHAVRLKYKGLRSWNSDWMSVVEEEAFRRIEGRY